MLSRLSTSVRLMISPPSARDPRMTRYSCQATWTKRTLLIFFCKDTSIPPFRKIMLSIVINKKTLKTPPATNCLITTYRPFYIASLLAYFAEKMYLCSVDISVGNGASRYQLGGLCD